MNVGVRHLLHPVRTIHRAGMLVREHVDTRRFVGRGRKHFIADARYDLEAVTAGFVNRSDAEFDDAALLQRICLAYRKAKLDEATAPTAYRPTRWWEMQRRGSLQPVVTALQHGNVEALSRMYRNFYRDACSAGLIIVQSLAKRYFNGRMTDQQRRYILADALYRLDYWKRVTNGSFAVADLTGPTAGNPFGVMVEATLVRAGSEYQHFCGIEVSKRVTGDYPVVAEIGGGYGGMAYYLLRERPRLKYVGFDVAESVALTSYFLMRAFPQRKFLLYGEAEPCEKSVAHTDVILLTVFAMRDLPLKAAVTFSSHAISDLSTTAQAEYALRISAMTSHCLICIGARVGMDNFDAALKSTGLWRIEQETTLEWSVHRNARASEVERVYRKQG